MQRKFLTNLGLILFLNFLVKPFWIFGIDRTVQNLVGAEEYGLYFAVFNFSFLFNILLDFGITNFNNKNIAQNNHLLNKHFSSILILKFVLAIVYFVVILIVALIIGYKFTQLYFLMFLAINQFLISLILYFRSNISGLLMFRTDSVLSVLDRVLMIGICSVLLWGHLFAVPFRIEWFVYAQTLAYILTAIIAAFVVIRKASFRKLNWNRPFFIMIIKQSFPFAILFLLMTIYNRLDSVMLERMLPGRTGKEQSGIYASAYRLLDAVNMIAFLFAGLLLPIFSRMLKLKESINQMVKLSTDLLITLSIIISFGTFFYSYPIMDLLYKEHVQASTNVFSILMFGFIPISITYIYGTLLTANGNLKYLNIMACLGMLLNLLLNFILIPHFQAVGSAWASLSTQLFTAIIQLLLVVRIFKFKMNLRYLSMLLLFVTCVILLNIITLRLNTHWLFSFALMLISSLSLAFILRLFHFRALMGILKRT
jgi:O-antigen/teichoic acid export membrane protein